MGKLWVTPLAAAFLSFVLLVPAARAVIVDRIAITVGNKVITASEIDRRVRLTAFQNGDKPDLGLASRRAAAQELIDQRLVEREMDIGRYPRLDSIRKQELLAEYEKAHYNSNRRALASALAEYGLSTADIEDDLARQSELLAFLNLRFRPAVQVTDLDIQRYFTEHMQKPEAQAGVLNELRARIEQQLTIERSDKELDAWLRDQRKRTRIQYAEPDLGEGLAAGVLASGTK